MTARLLCGSAPALSPEDRLKNNVIWLGGSLLFAAACIILSAAGERAAGQLLASVVFPIALVVAGYWTYLKPYPPAVRIRLTVINGAIVLTIVLIAAAIVRLR